MMAMSNAQFSTFSLQQATARTITRAKHFNFMNVRKLTKSSTAKALKRRAAMCQSCQTKIENDFFREFIVYSINGSFIKRAVLTIHHTSPLAIARIID